MASSKSRQRALARAKVERQIARRAAQARRRRQWQGGIGAGLAVLLVVLGVVWVSGGFDRKKTTASGDCAWTPQDTSTNPNLKDVGLPSTSGITKQGTRPMTITTSQGTLKAELDLAKAPCAAASFAHLSGKQFFENTKCHRLTTEGIFVLQCGDPSGTGSGGPAYKFGDEYRPSPPPPGNASEPASQQVVYPKGTLAMANSGADSNGSQFFIVYKDTTFKPDYTVIGTVVEGIGVVEKVAEGGVAGGNGSDGAPKTEVLIQSLTVGDPVPATSPAPSTPAPSPAPTSPAASPPATPSPKS